MSDRQPEPVADPSRRRLLGAGLAVGGGAVAGGLAGAGAAVATGGDAWRREELTIEVAMRGDTWRDAETRNRANDADFRIPFAVEGFIYPADTLPEEGFVPTLADAIGHWFCKGWMVLDENRPAPHFITTQDYILGVISPERTFPPDSLASSGLEGGEPDQPMTRAVTGGGGQWRGAGGEVIETIIGDNTSVVGTEVPFPGANLRFDFDLWLPG